MCNGKKGNVLHKAVQAKKLHAKASERIEYIFFIPIDCSNGDDEGRECENTKNCPLSCQPNGKCVTLSKGPICVCPKGYEYDEKKQRCEVPQLKSKSIYQETCFIWQNARYNLIFF